MAHPNVSNQALTVAAKSPYPIFANGDAMMFGTSLFAVVAIVCLLLMRLIATVRQIICDWGVKGREAVLSFRVMVVLVCLTGLTSRIPDAFYKIAWGEVTPQTLHTALSIKEWGNSIAFWLVLGWLGVHTYFEPLWTLKLANPLNRVWGGNLAQVRRFVLIVFLSGLLAGAIAISKALH